ncbi:MAG TPA: 50S ribosomal protein L17, partial [Bacteroidetes bacterium]|nr:50S ribosomal protein L17 [Bacteroidota bacterium]
MRHRKSNVGLNRTASHRRALLANLAGALFTHKKIITTLPKAKKARPFIERMITFARRGDLAARRQVLKKIPQKPVVRILFDEIGPKFRDRNGGYTRIIHLDNRPGDNAPMAVLELVGFATDEPSKARKRREKKAAKAEAAAATEAAEAATETAAGEVTAEETAAEAEAEEATPAAEEKPVKAAPAKKPAAAKAEKKSAPKAKAEDAPVEGEGEKPEAAKPAKPKAAVKKAEPKEKVKPADAGKEEAAP